MNILTYTSLFPNNVNPNFGVFIKNRMFNYKEFSKAKMSVIAPIPYFPKVNISQKWFAFSQVAKEEFVDDVPIYHPRFFVTPKIGMAFYGLNMFLGSYRLAKKLHKQYKFDLIDAHYIYPDCYAAMLISKMLDIPLIVSARGTDINLYPKFKLCYIQMKKVLTHANTIIAVSQSISDEIKQKFNITEVQTVHNGIDHNKFYSINQDVVRHKLNINKDCKLILSVGGLNKRKGFQLLIDSFNILCKKYKNLKLYIIGDGEEYQSLQKRIHENDLQKYVKLIGAINHNVLLYWYNACDVFCLASSREGWPNVIMEAHACGKPVVATNVWGIPEIIQSDDYGLLVDNFDCKKFADALEAAINKKWDFNKILNYSQQFTWQKVSEKLDIIFSESILS